MVNIKYAHIVFSRERKRGDTNMQAISLVYRQIKIYQDRVQGIQTTHPNNEHDVETRRTAQQADFPNYTRKRELLENIRVDELQNF